MVRGKSDWEREKKKLQIEHEKKVGQIEEDFQEEMRTTKEKIERTWKKKVQDKDGQWEGKFDELEQEMNLLRETHRHELKAERQRVHDVE